MLCLPSMTSFLLGVFGKVVLRAQILQKLRETLIFLCPSDIFKLILLPGCLIDKLLLTHTKELKVKSVHRTHFEHLSIWTMTMALLQLAQKYRIWQNSVVPLDSELRFSCSLILGTQFCCDVASKSWHLFDECRKRKLSLWCAWRVAQTQLIFNAWTIFL